MELKHFFLKQLFFGIKKSWFTIVTFDMLYSTLYADPGYKMQEQHPAYYIESPLQVLTGPNAA
jgi:hypothetical protein